MKELTAKQLRNKVVNELWSYGNLPKNIQEFMGDEVAFMIEIIDTKVKEQLALSRVVGKSEQLVCDCGNKLTDKEIYFGQCLQCDKNIEEAN